MSIILLPRSSVAAKSLMEARNVDCSPKAAAAKNAQENGWMPISMRDDLQGIRGPCENNVQ